MEGNYEGDILENETIINYETYKKFYLFALFKGRYYKMGPKLFYIISAIGIFVSLITGFVFGFDSVIKIFLILFIILIAVMSLLIFYLPKKYYKSAEKIYQGINRYKFFDDYFQAEMDNGSAKGTSNIKYDALYKVYEIPEYFYIFISRSQAYMVDKSGFNIIELDSLTAIFKNVLGKKYYKYC